MTRLGWIRVSFVVAWAALIGSSAAGDNELTEQERRDGWILLFDGKSTAGWMSILREPLPQRHVQEGALNPHPCRYMLVHRRDWSDFELKLDFKISPKCNSGVFFRTFPLEPRPGKDVGFNGIEVAVDDGKGAGFHDTGALYDLVKPSENAMKPAGQWNSMRLVCDGPKATTEINGKKAAAMNLDEWVLPNRRPDGSHHKFDVAYKDHPRHGYIGLQDHGADCWYRNIKLKPLGKAKRSSGSTATP